jgi:hypothetical protein
LPLLFPLGSFLGPLLFNVRYGSPYHLKCEHHPLLHLVPRDSGFLQHGQKRPALEYNLGANLIEQADTEPIKAGEVLGVFSVPVIPITPIVPPRL